MNIINLGQHLATNKSVALTTQQLTRHAAIMGMTGSGKTGVIANLFEHYAKYNVPCILVDIKGDMCNLVLQPVEFRNKINLRILTPGGFHGEQIDLFADLQRPERVKNTVTQLLKMIGERRVDPLSSKQHSFLSKLLHHYHGTKEEVNLTKLIVGVLDPPFHSFGALSLDDAFPSSARNALAAKLNNLLVAPSFEKWRSGIKLDVDELLARSHQPGAPTNVTVFSVAHLDEEEKLFALALLFDSVAAWMRKQQGDNDLRAALFVDECVGLLPPYPANPATKGSLLIMLKQARAHGLGLVLASQNPMDLDYKALGNCETWIVGRLQMANDRKRVIDAITASTSHDRAKLEARIGRLLPRNFVLCRPRSTADFYSKNVCAKLIGPMTVGDIESLTHSYNSETKRLADAYRELYK